MHDPMMNQIDTLDVLCQLPLTRCLCTSFCQLDVILLERKISQLHLFNSAKCVVCVYACTCVCVCVPSCLYFLRYKTTFDVAVTYFD